jgi:enamine deaminase RidA (YjgF/YER057c/UK114 family)
MEFLNPETIAPPASDYSHGVVVPAAARRLIVAGQVGLMPDGSLAEGFEAQMERCWLNLFAVLEAAGMTKRDLVKYTVFVTATYVVVAGLASPALLVEIEGEAVAE